MLFCMYIYIYIVFIIVVTIVTTYLLSYYSISNICILTSSTFSLQYCLEFQDYYVVDLQCFTHFDFCFS